MTIINAKRWFNKRLGLTYHSVSVNMDGKDIGYATMVYGYNDHYLHTAFKILQDKGLWPKTDRVSVGGYSPDEYDFRRDMIDNHNKYHITCADVTRKKDL